MHTVTLHCARNYFSCTDGFRIYSIYIISLLASPLTDSFAFCVTNASIQYYLFWIILECKKNQTGIHFKSSLKTRMSKLERISFECKVNLLSEGGVSEIGLSISPPCPFPFNAALDIDIVGKH